MRFTISCFIVSMLLATSAQASLERSNPAGQYMNKYDMTRTSDGGYLITARPGFQRIFVRVNGIFESLYLADNGDFHSSNFRCNPSIPHACHGGQPLSDSYLEALERNAEGKTIITSDLSKEKIYVKGLDGTLYLLSFDGRKWFSTSQITQLPGGSGTTSSSSSSTSSGGGDPDIEDPDDNTVDNDHDGSDPLCNLTGTCNSSSGSTSTSSGSSSSSSSSSGSSSSSSSSGSSTSSSSSGSNSLTPPGSTVTIPDALRTIQVCTDNALRTAISNAQAGDHIVLCEREWKTFRVENKHGTAANPIVIKAVKPATTGGKVRFSRTAGTSTVTTIEHSTHIIIDGMLAENPGYGFNILYGSKNITIYRNVLIEPDPFYTSKSGYGLRTHVADEVKVIGNVFRGFFNHSVSMKERTPHMYIIGNLFDGCGYECINLGQMPDGFQGIADMTSGIAIVKDNHFTGRQTQTGAGMNGVRVVNVQQAYIEDNTFEGTWKAQINVSYGSIGPKHVRPTDILKPSGPKTLDVLQIKNNRFANSGKLELFGRGEANDIIDVTNNTGSPNCVIGGFSTQGGVGGYLGNVYQGPPIVRQSGNSFACN